MVWMLFQGQCPNCTERWLQRGEATDTEELCRQLWTHTTASRCRTLLRCTQSQLGPATNLPCPPLVQQPGPAGRGLHVPRFPARPGQEPLRSVYAVRCCGGQRPFCTTHTRTEGWRQVSRSSVPLASSRTRMACCFCGNVPLTTQLVGHPQRRGPLLPGRPLQARSRLMEHWAQALRAAIAGAPAAVSAASTAPRAAVRHRGWTPLKRLDTKRPHSEQADKPCASMYSCGMASSEVSWRGCVRGA